jgi:hypothetical protein
VLSILLRIFVLLRGWKRAVRRGIHFQISIPFSTLFHQLSLKRDYLVSSETNRRGWFVAFSLMRLYNAVKTARKWLGTRATRSCP